MHENILNVRFYLSDKISDDEMYNVQIRGIN